LVGVVVQAMRDWHTLKACDVIDSVPELCSFGAVQVETVANDLVDLQTHSGFLGTFGRIISSSPFA
jgi:hypothetical protein